MNREEPRINIGFEVSPIRATFACTHATQPYTTIATCLNPGCPCQYPSQAP